jgi:hypothetical protein
MKYFDLKTNVIISDLKSWKETKFADPQCPQQTWQNVVPLPVLDAWEILDILSCKKAENVAIFVAHISYQFGQENKTENPFSRC